MFPVALETPFGHVLFIKEINALRVPPNVYVAWGPYRGKS
jgi:hypothetical protein